MCQLTWASTRITVCPLPPPATSTTRSRAFSTPGIGDSEKCAVPGRRPKIGVSGDETAKQVRLLPGEYRLRLGGHPPEGHVIDQPGGDDGSDRNLERIRHLRQPLHARGTANAFKMAAASATARSRGVGDTAVTDLAAVCVAAQPAMAAQAASRSVVSGAHRTWGRTPVGRPAGHRGSASGNKPILSAWGNARMQPRMFP